MKKIVLLALLLNLISCLEDNPCDNVKYKLNESGGFGRNEVTFLIDGEAVWHSNLTYVSIYQNTLKDEKGKTIKDSLNNPIYIDNFDLKFVERNSNECKNFYFNGFDLELVLYGFNEKSSEINKVKVYIVNYFKNNIKPGYSNTKSETFKSNVYWNRKDSIIYGTFSGELYSYKQINGEFVYDTIRITKGVFDFRYKSQHFHGEM